MNEREQDIIMESDEPVIKFSDNLALPASECKTINCLPSDADRLYSLFESKRIPCAVMRDEFSRKPSVSFCFPREYGPYNRKNKNISMNERGIDKMVRSFFSSGQKQLTVLDDPSKLARENGEHKFTMFRGISEQEVRILEHNINGKFQFAAVPQPDQSYQLYILDENKNLLQEEMVLAKVESQRTPLFGDKLSYENQEKERAYQMTLGREDFYVISPDKERYIDENGNEHIPPLEEYFRYISEKQAFERVSMIDGEEKVTERCSAEEDSERFRLRIATMLNGITLPVVLNEKEFKKDHGQLLEEKTGHFQEVNNRDYVKERHIAGVINRKIHQASLEYNDPMDLYADRSEMNDIIEEVSLQEGTVYYGSGPEDITVETVTIDNTGALTEQFQEACMETEEPETEYIITNDLDKEIENIRLEIEEQRQIDHQLGDDMEEREETVFERSIDIE